jgi:hypothetical protein
MTSKSRIGNKPLHIFIQTNITVNLCLYETIESSAQEAILRIEKRLLRPVPQLVQKTGNRQVVYTEGPASLFELSNHVRHNRIECVERSCVLVRIWLLAATERERRAPGNVRMKQQITGAKARRRSVRMRHHFESAVFWTARRQRVARMVSATEESHLPLVTFAAWKSRRAPARQSGLELGSVNAVMKETLGHAPSSAINTLRMKVKCNPGMGMEVFQSIVVNALVQRSFPENRPYDIAGPGASHYRARVHVLKSASLIWQ